MHTTPTLLRLTILERAVLETLAYSDLFDYPLTPEEVHHWLPLPATATDVDEALQSRDLAALVKRTGGFVTLVGREKIVAIRERRRISSERLGRTAERYGGIIGRLPFVRMVAITGSLAVDNADPGDDLDYLIVTAPGRVWTVRAMLMALGRLAALRGITLCPNYLLAETALALPQPDFYNARELLQMRPVAGHPTYERMLAANPWWHDHLPNASPALIPSSPSPRKERGSGGEVISSPSPPAGRGPGGGVSPFRRITEAFLRLPPFDALERWILTRKGAELRSRSGGPETVFDETMCKGHADAWRTRTQDRLEASMKALQARLLDIAHNAGTSNGAHQP